MRCLRQYIKKVRELHRKLEHYEHGGGDSVHGGGLALRDMEGVLAQRDASVLGQTRKLMSTQQRLVDALGCGHHALWQSENHLTLTHVESPPSELSKTCGGSCARCKRWWSRNHPRRPSPRHRLDGEWSRLVLHTGKSRTSEYVAVMRLSVRIVLRN
jgi:hypothetical protein